MSIRKRLPIKDLIKWESFTEMPHGVEKLSQKIRKIKKDVNGEYIWKDNKLYICIWKAKCKLESK